MLSSKHLFYFHHFVVNLFVVFFNEFLTVSAGEYVRLLGY